MRIPDNTVHQSQIKTYGSTGLASPDYEQLAGCPALYKAKYVDFSVKEPPAENFEYGSLVHDALFLAEEEGLPLIPDALDKAISRTDLPLGPQHYSEARSDLQKYMDRGGDSLATVAVEQHLKAPLMEYDGEQFFFGGYVDKISVDPEDPLTLFMTDYKTNRAPFSQVAVDQDVQFTHYLALLQMNAHQYLPDADPTDLRFVMVVDAIKWYQLFTVREPWQIEDYLDWLRAMVRRIHDDEEGEPQINPSCSWCPKKFDCKAFARLPGRGDTLADRMSVKTDLKQRVYFMQQAELVVRSLTSAVDEVKAELKQQAGSNGDGLVFNGVKYEVVDSWNVEYDLPGLHQRLGSKFYNVVNPVAYKLKDLAKEDPKLANDLEKLQKRLPLSKRLKASRVRE